VFVDKPTSPVRDICDGITFECLNESGKALGQKYIVRIHPTDIWGLATFDAFIDARRLTFIGRAAPPGEPMSPTRYDAVRLVG
jgi:hypothetical protein